MGVAAGDVPQTYKGGRKGEGIYINILFIDSCFSLSLSPPSPCRFASGNKKGWGRFFGGVLFTAVAVATKPRLDFIIIGFGETHTRDRVQYVCYFFKFIFTCFIFVNYFLL